MRQLSIAVVGSGISGLASAWLLSKRHRVTLFERAGRLGGHVNTVDIAAPDGVIGVDTGFIVYNARTYPNLTALYDHLGVATAASSMGFAVSLGGGAYEYSGTGLQGLFGQPSNLFRSEHIRMIVDIARFFQEVGRVDPQAVDPDLSLGQWLQINGYSAAFADNHILPMGAAIWSAPVSQIFDFPFSTFARFFHNHGLLRLNGRPKWRTVLGGARNYVDKLIEDFSGTVRTGFEISRIVRSDRGVDIHCADGIVQRFDHCILATHADQALQLLADPDDDERRVLSNFRYCDNTAILHTDTSMMPLRRRLWSSWNYVSSDRAGAAGVTYWMNALQPLSTAMNLFVSLNPDRDIPAAKQLQAFNYRHPVFDSHAIDHQQHLWNLQGRRRTWFAGSYFGYGFHEDGLQAGLAVAEELGGVRRPWQVAHDSGRISFGQAPAPAAAMLEAAQ